MNFLGYGKEYVFHSALNTDECVKSLANSVGKKSSYNDVQVKTNGNKFQLFRKADTSNSSYNPVFYGNVVTDGKGSRIEGYFGLSIISLVVTSLLFLWFIIMPLLASNFKITWSMILVILLVLSICSLITVGNLLWGKKKMKPILDFIQHELGTNTIKL